MTPIVEQSSSRASGGWKYFLGSVILWALVDFGVGYHFDLTAWISGMPIVWIFYVGWPLLFYYLFYFRLWDGSRALLLVVALSYLMEAVILDNPLVYNIPQLFLYIPITILLYSLVTFVPLWIAEGSMLRHWGKTVIMVGVALVFALFG